jgi:hypothetical protein
MTLQMGMRNTGRMSKSLAAEALRIPPVFGEKAEKSKRSDPSTVALNLFTNGDPQTVLNCLFFKQEKCSANKAFSRFRRRLSVAHTQNAISSQISSNDNPQGVHVDGKNTPRGEDQEATGR